MAQAVKIFSKSLSDTDVHKRLTVPAKGLSSLPHFNGGTAVTIHLIYKTRIWPIVCQIRKKGYKKPVFSGGWRKFVVFNNLKIGDKLTLYKIQDAGNYFHYSVQVEKPAARPTGALADATSRIFGTNLNQATSKAITEDGAIPRTPYVEVNLNLTLAPPINV